jgi:hypothetical protein
MLRRRLAFELRLRLVGRLRRVRRRRLVWLSPRFAPRLPELRLRLRLLVGLRRLQFVLRDLDAVVLLDLRHGRQLLRLRRHGDGQCKRNGYRHDGSADGLVYSDTGPEHGSFHTRAVGPGPQRAPDAQHGPGAGSYASAFHAVVARAAFAFGAREVRGRPANSQRSWRIAGADRR